MISLAQLKRRLGQYGATWVVGFLVSGIGILVGMIFADMIAMTDLVLPIAMAGVVLALGVGVVMTWLSDQTLGTKIAVLVLALLLLLPLLWAPVSAAVVIAFITDRAIEYSTVYAAFQIRVSELLFPLGQMLFGPSLFGMIWSAFQVVASIVGFISALANIWPIIRRVLGPDTPQDGSVAE